MAVGRVVVTGGALGVDYIASQAVFEADPSVQLLRIILPANLEVYAAHYRSQAEQGVVTHAEVEDLIMQLRHAREQNSGCLIEGPAREVSRDAYYHRNSLIVECSLALRAFQVNESPGTQDTLVKARAKGIAIRHYSYQSSAGGGEFYRSVSEE